MHIRHFLPGLVCLACVVSCGRTPKSPVQSKLDEYVTVKLSSPYISGISDHGKEVLNLYRFAAQEVDMIYWEQSFGDPTPLLAISDPAAREYAQINYGPWDRATGASFVEGYAKRPLGANFYPQDMTDEEWEAFADTTKNSPYTMISRGEDGKLQARWYHDAFEDHLSKIAAYLQAAADLTIVPSVRDYLLAKIEALRTDDYYASDIAWLQMDNSKMDLVIGPNETLDDQRYGIKKSYEAFVLLKELEKTEQLSKFTSMLPELQASLPCPDEYKMFVPGSSSNIFACDALYYAGAANAGIKVIAINLPYDPKVQEEMGTRTILLRNVMDEKFNRILSPIGNIVLSSEQRSHLSSEAFFWNIAMREVAHGLGVKQTITSKQSVEEALGNEALAFEEMKGNVVGMYLSTNLIASHHIPEIVTVEDALTTFFVSLVRSERYGEGEALGRANIAIFNYLQENGAFNRDGSGRYTLDYGKMKDAIRSLSSLILKTQAEGDRAFATAFMTKYGVLAPTFKEDLRNIRLEGIPTDVRFVN